MRPRSLPVDPVSYPITTAARGKEGGRRGAGWGCRGSWWELYREYRKREKKKEYSGVCLNLFRRMQHVSVAEVNTHACHHRFRKRKVVAKKKKKKYFFYLQLQEKMCVQDRWRFQRVRSSLWNVRGCGVCGVCADCRFSSAYTLVSVLYNVGTRIFCVCALCIQ